MYSQQIQELLNIFWEQQRNKRIHRVSNLNHRILDLHSYQRLLQHGEKIASYEFDYASNTVQTVDFQGTVSTKLDRSKMHLDLALPAQAFRNKISILLTVNTVADQNLELVITPISGAWRPKAESAVRRVYCQSGWDLPMSHTVFVDPVGADVSVIKFRQYLDSGDTRFWYD